MAIRNTILSAILAFTLCNPANAGQVLPNIQPAKPVFEHAHSGTNKLFCGRNLGKGAHFRGGIQKTFMEPIASIGQDIAQLFRPLFGEADTHQARSYSTVVGQPRRRHMPSEVVNWVGRQKMCS